MFLDGPRREERHPSERCQALSASQAALEALEGGPRGPNRRSLLDLFVWFSHYRLFGLGSVQDGPRGA
eukprot:7597987-Pyramimonas_sp.AAC.1